jgi:putative transposase
MEEQYAFALRQSETGTRVAEVCRKLGISEQTFFPLEPRVRVGSAYRDSVA